MDYVSHGAWSYIFFNKIRRPFLAVIFGLMPDTLSWFIYAVYNLFSGSRFGRPSLSSIPNWAFDLYNISHSLLVAAAVILLIYIILKRVPIYIFAWPIAILMDVPTHTREFLPTPFLWPVSDWGFPGISWGTRWFMILNYSAIVILMIIIVYRKRRKDKTDA